MVLLQAGHTVYVSMRARLWKCSSEQLRAATHYESLGASLSESSKLRDVLQQGRLVRCGAVDVAAEGPPPDMLKTNLSKKPDQTSKWREALVCLPMANRGRTSSRLSNRTADEPQVEPGPRSGASSRKPSAAQPNEDAVSEASSSADSTAGRVKRQVSEIDSKESARLEKEALRELRRWDRESKLLRRASASDVATSTKMPRKSEPAGPSSSGGSLSSTCSTTGC